MDISTREASSTLFRDYAFERGLSVHSLLSPQAEECVASL